MAQDMKLFVVAHKPVPLPTHKPFVPIQVGSGAPIAGVQLRDNTGDNIAKKNPNYCELTAQYWIWKNVKADVVGLCHYRRLPSFSGCADAIFNDFSEETCKRFGWDEETIGRLMQRYDILLSPCWDIFPPGEPGNIMTPYCFHATEHRASDIAETLRVIQDVTPEMAPYAHQALCVDTKQCFGNICVMRKPLFDAYSEWLFKVLFELERRIEIPADKEQARVFGYLSERLIMVWLAYAKATQNVRVWFANQIPLGEFPEPALSEKVLVAKRERRISPKLSVIIPVYNVEKYLHRCLNSVCSQCEEDIEILCVNDGSTDGSREILQAFADKDQRIRIIDQENKGLGAARNRGIDEAKGTYLAFVDSDDWVDRFIWYRSLRKMEDQRLELLLFEPQDISDETGEVLFNNWNRLRLPTHCYQDAFTWRDIGRTPFDTVVYAHNKVIRRDFWGARRFPVGVLYEDAVIHFDLFFSAQRIGALACPFYFYRRRTNSLMSTGDIRVFDHLKIIDGTAEVLERLGLFQELEALFMQHAEHLIQTTYDRYLGEDVYERLRAWLAMAPQCNWAWNNSLLEAIQSGVMTRNATQRITTIEGCSPRTASIGAVLRKVLPAPSRLKLLLPYGVMCLWLRSYYGIVEDQPLFAYPGFFKRCKRIVKFALPYGLVKRFRRS